MVFKDVLVGFLLLFSIFGIYELIFIFIGFTQRDTSHPGVMNGSISLQGIGNIRMGNVPRGQSEEMDTGRLPGLIKRSNLRIER